MGNKYEKGSIILGAANNFFWYLRQILNLLKKNRENSTLCYNIENIHGFLTHIIFQLKFPSAYEEFKPFVDSGCLTKNTIKSLP